MNTPPIPPAAATLAAALIADEEGLRLSRYYDAVGGVWSIGFGFCTLADGSPVTAHTMPLTAAQCDALLATKLAQDYMPGVQRVMACPMTTGQFAALTSFAYNLGIGTLAHSAIPRLGQAGAWSGVVSAMQAYNRASGQVCADLVGRRRREGAVLMGQTFIAGKRTGGALGTLSAPVQQQLHAGPAPARTPGMMRPVVGAPQPGADALMDKYE